MILTELEKQKAFRKKTTRSGWSKKRGEGKGYTTRTLADGSISYKVTVGRKYIGTFYTPEEAKACYDETISRGIK